MTERQQMRYLLELTAKQAELTPAAAPSQKNTALRQVSASQAQSKSQSKGQSKNQPAKKYAPSVVTHTAHISEFDHERDLLTLAIGGDALSTDRLRSFKRVADDLLPNMRRDNHLHHLINSQSSHNLLMRPPAPLQDAAVRNDIIPGEAREDAVLGGASFRLLKLDSALVMVVNVIVVTQEEGVCRRGYGGKLVKELKALLSREVDRCGADTGFMLAQADDGAKASNFWHKHKLRRTTRAASLLETLHTAAPKLVGMYEGSSSMAWQLPLRSRQPPRPSTTPAAETDIECACGDALDLGLKRLSLG